MTCCKDIKPGSFRHTIIIQRATRTPIGGGSNTTMWNTHLTLRCKLTPLSSNERIYAQRIESDITHRILMRYVADILPSDRVNFNGRYFNIKPPLNLEEANRYLEIGAVEGPAT